MQKITCLLLFLLTISVSAQDFILTTNNEEISVKVEEINIETISYKKTENLNGPIYHIELSDVAKITFENGTVETFQSVSSNTSDPDDVSMAETKAFLLENIDKYCYEHNGHMKKSLKASFEGDYLRITAMNKKGTKSINSWLFDFENVYVFKGIDKRNNDQAYLNIYVPFLKYEKKDKWEKMKLVMSVDGHENAKSIKNALKHYSNLLKEQNKKPGQKF